MAQYRNGKTVAWTALIIAILALVIAVLAYSSNGQGMQDAASDDVNGAAIEMRADLQATEEELMADEDNDAEADEDEGDAPDDTEESAE